MKVIMMAYERQLHLLGELAVARLPASYWALHNKKGPTCPVSPSIHYNYYLFHHFDPAGQEPDLFLRLGDGVDLGF